MSCGCEQPGRRMGRLGRLRGPMLAAGSQFKVGLKFSGNYNITDVINQLEGCLYNTGAFNSLDFQFTDSYFSPGYLLVSGENSIDFGNIEDAGDLIQGQFLQCVSNVDYKGRDRLTYTPPASVAGNQAYGQGQESSGNIVCGPGYYYDPGILFGYGAGCRPKAGTPGQPPSDKGLDDLFKGETGGLLLIGGLALVALLVLKK